MNLNELLWGFVTTENLPRDTLDLQVTGLVLDSRKAEAGHVFIALDGAKQHGMQHAEQAIAKGASVIMYEPKGGGGALAEAIGAVPTIAVDSLALKLGEIAARFYGDPSRELAVIGITGTNGKTSCSQFLSQVLDGCGIIGTLGWGGFGQLNKTLNTTPDALAVQQIFSEFVKTKMQSVAMEVSSHGLDMGRVNGVQFKGVVFTNISRDHLDYHGTMEAYLQAKLTLLTKPSVEFAVVNVDDAYSAEIIAAVPETVALWAVSAKGQKTQAAETLVAQNIAHTTEGMSFDVQWRDESQKIHVPLFGEFNVENTLSVLAVMLALGIGLAESVRRLSPIKPVAGRMESFGGGTQPLVFVDYAHTSDALDKVLSSVRYHCKQKLWVVFGCGGNRDKGKRPQMGRIAEAWADHVIVTDDNPRDENSTAIVNDILAGCLNAQNTKVEVIQDRAVAIKTAVTAAARGDVVVVAGKGHEDYQEINGVHTHFSDKEQVQNALGMRG